MSDQTSPPTGSVPAGKGPMERFEDYLKANRLRMTPERRAVLETILDREGHFDAEELLQFTRRRNKRVSRATLYRTLEHLRLAGLVKMHRFGSGHALFEHVYGRKHHDHMVCNNCGTVIEFVNEEIERLQNEVCREHRFHATSHVMQIFGLCDTCQSQEGSSTSS
jgi:Fur family transcriptional regulator, ferric uptake regulator